MSGPWDRPSRGPDGDWPSEDLGSANAGQPAAADPDPWASGDLWPDERREGSPWTDWPSAGSPDDELYDDPPRTLSDPWAESWNDAPEEPPDAAASVAPAATSEPAWTPEPRTADPSPDTWRGAAPEVEPAEWQPSDEAALEPAPTVEPPAEEAPDQRRWARVEPWQPDADPWGVVVPDASPPGDAADTAEADGAVPGGDVAAIGTDVDTPPADVGPASWGASPASRDDAVADGPTADVQDQPPGDAAAAFDAAPDAAPAMRAWPWSRPRDPHELDWLPEPIVDEPTATVPDAVGDDVRSAELEAETAVDAEPAVAAADHDPGGPTLDAVGIEIDEPIEAVSDPSVADRGDRVFAPEDDAAPGRVPAADVAPEDSTADHTAASEPAPDEVAAVEPAGVEAAEVEAEPVDAETGASASGAESAWVARWFARRRSTRPEEEDAAVADGVDAVEQDASVADGVDAAEAGAAVDAVEQDVADESSGDDGLRDAGGSPAPFEPPAPAWVPAPEPLFPTPAVDAVGDRDTDRSTPEPEAWPLRDRPWSDEPPGASAAADRGVGVAPDDRSVDAPSESTQVLPTTWEPSVPPRPIDRGLEPVAASPRTRLAAPEPDLGDDLDGEPSTAEQAVPWLIGFILLLAGMVIVLLALIFAGDESLAGAGSSPSPTNVAVVTPPSDEPSPSDAATPAPTPTPAPSVSVAPTPTPLPIPEYGPLEMVYQGRSAALAPIYLLRRDFTVEDDPTVMAQDASLDVRRFAWAPDGTRGAGLLANVLVSIEEGAEKRRLGDDITTVTFGADGSTVYAVRIAQDGGNDVANILGIDFDSGDTTELASISYARPSIAEEAALEEAQFADDGGAVRLYWMDDGVLRLWVLGAGSWNISPDGDVSELDRDEVPLLFAPRGGKRVSVGDGATSTLVLVDDDGEEMASTTVEGLVSHLRWSPSGERVVFTLGRLAGGGGILQDLFLWDLADGQAPTQLTNTGANFGAEWLGGAAVWRDE